MKIFKNKEKKQIFLSAILLVIIIALYIEFNLLVSKLKINDIDITESKVYSISEESKEKINKLDKDIKIYLVGFDKYEDYSYTSDIKYILNEINKINNKISIESYDALNSDDLNVDKKYPYIVFECEDRARVVSINEIFQYRYNTLYEYQEELYVIDPLITNSIVSVANNLQNDIYIYYNKSIYRDTMYTSFVNIAGVLGFDTYVLNLEADNKIPDNCKCIVIPPLVDENIKPTDLSEQEKNIIEEYINKGGNILFIQESKSLMNGETPNLDYLMGLYGMHISDGIIFQSENTMVNTPSYIYPEVIENKVWKSINSDSKINVFDAGKIELSNDEKLNVTHNILIQAGKNAFLRKDLNNKSIDKAESDIDASNAVIGVYAEKNVGENKSKAILFSNSVITTNATVFLPNSLSDKRIKMEAILVNNNSELIADSINLLANNSDSVYSAKSKYHLVPSVNILTDGITLKIIFIIPMIVIIVGFAIWRYRKNKK